MREIIFRGKANNTGKWVYGDYFRNGAFHFIRTKDEIGFTSDRDVDPETVGQFTGLLDRNGNKIFEGDIILDDGDELIIEYDINTSAFIGICQRKKMGYDLNSEYSYKIIGNIYA